jgi:hypothetical protein
MLARSQRTPPALESARRQKLQAHSTVRAKKKRSFWPLSAMRAHMGLQNNKKENRMLRTGPYGLLLRNIRFLYKNTIQNRFIMDNAKAALKSMSHSPRPSRRSLPHAPIRLPARGRAAAQHALAPAGRARPAAGRSSARGTARGSSAAKARATASRPNAASLR